MKKYKITYYGSCRGHQAGALYEEVLSEEEYKKLTVSDIHEHERMAQETAEDYFEVGGWVQFEEIDED